jgi:phage terminase large subunit
MYIGVIWVEEADQLKGEDALRNIKQSAFRGGDDGFLFRSYNTPISASHYINVQELEQNPKRLIHHSNFKNAPREWLGDRFYSDAEQLKATNERAYRHEYDGEATGTGNNVFENLDVKTKITDAEISNFAARYCGLDFGYYPDPAVFIECYYNPSKQELWIYKELKLLKASNEVLAEKLAEYRKREDLIIADSEEPKSIADFKAWGFKMIGAKKGADSVRYSIQWLQHLKKIHIDPVRCPYTANEFMTYEYEVDDAGQPITGFPDKNNHGIDSTRYALNYLWKQRGL